MIIKHNLGIDNIYIGYSIFYDEYFIELLKNGKSKFIWTGEIERSIFKFRFLVV